MTSENKKVQQKLISIVTPCFNEEKNVEGLFLAVENVFQKLPGYVFEHIFIDNASTDETANILRKMASTDNRIKVILNKKTLVIFVLRITDPCNQLVMPWYYW